MNWLTVTWSMTSSACMTLALIHLTIWFMDRTNGVHLLFAATALGVAGIGMGELHMMLAQTPEQYGWWLRWTHVPIFVTVVSIVWFVHFYFNTGRTWLAWLICATRLLILVINFSVATNFNFAEISAVRQIPVFGGVEVSIAQGAVSPRSRIGELVSLLLLVYLLDATISLWRKGNGSQRRRAVIVGGSMVFFVLVASGHVTLIHAGLIHWPYALSIPFLFPVAALGYELGADVVRSGRLARELDVSRLELRDSEHRMELAATAAELAMWRWDISKDQIWMSGKGRRLFGLADFEPINFNRFLQVVHPDDRAKLTHSIVSLMNGNGNYECEFRVCVQGGQLRLMSSRGRVEFDGKGNPILLHGVSLDVTAQKLADQRIGLIVESAPNAIILVNSEGVMTLVNAQTEAMFGYARDELIGRPVETLLPERLRVAHPDHRREYLTAPQARAMGAGRELRGRRKDGSEIQVEIVLSPIQTFDGASILASVTDVTEQRRFEQEQVQLRSELTHLSRAAMLGGLSGSLAHELNQPLTAILSNAQAAQEFLADQSPDLDEVQNILKDIVEEDKRAGEVIRRLRLLFRKGETQHEAIDMNEVVVEVLKLMNGELVNQGVTLEMELATDLPKINGDWIQFQQVLINLIFNASEAMNDLDPHDRRIRVSTAFDAGHDQVHLRVADSGCGIPPGRIDWIFEPYHTTKDKGMGLGLPVCHSIVSAHGGTIRATNNPDRGASFQVAFSAITMKIA